MHVESRKILEIQAKVQGNLGLIIEGIHDVGIWNLGTLESGNTGKKAAVQHRSTCPKLKDGYLDIATFSQLGGVAGSSTDGYAVHTYCGAARLCLPTS